MGAQKYEMKAVKQGLVVIAGSFAPNGSSALSSASTLGAGFTVARTGVGVFTVTLSDKYTACHSIVPAGMGAAIFIEASAWNSSTNSFTITNLDDVAGSAADVAANAANRINFIAVMQGPLSS
jgi:hypothetical protein